MEDNHDKRLVAMHHSSFRTLAESNSNNERSVIIYFTNPALRGITGLDEVGFGLSEIQMKELIGALKQAEAWFQLNTRYKDEIGDLKRGL